MEAQQPILKRGTEIQAGELPLKILCILHKSVACRIPNARQILIPFDKIEQIVAAKEKQEQIDGSHTA